MMQSSGMPRIEKLLKAALIENWFVVAKGEFDDGCAWGHDLEVLASNLKGEQDDFPMEWSDRR